MRAFFRALQALWSVSLAEMLQYRTEIALWAVWGIIYPAVSLAMWTAASQAQVDGAIGSYDPARFAAYFLITMIAGHLATAWDAYEFGHLVQSGALSPQLLRPIAPIWRSACDNTAYKLLTLVILTPLWAGVAWVTQPHFDTSPGQFVGGVLALFLGAILNYIWNYSIAVLAFWTTRTDAISEFWFGGSLVFGGRLAPLSLLPWPLDVISMVLPFRWIIGFPADALIGAIPATAIWTGILWQLVWIALGVVVYRVLWPIGLRRYSAVGA